MHYENVELAMMQFLPGLVIGQIEHGCRVRWSIECRRIVGGRLGVIWKQGLGMNEDGLEEVPW